jgi:ABC-type sugar transport system ATPase subunit
MPHVGDVLLEGRGLSKFYGPSRALEDVDIRITRGSIHGLLGKNGAGKSTLAGVISGTVRPDQGSLHLAGSHLGHDNAATRRRQGVRLLGQHSEILEHLTVTENLLLADLPRRAGVVQWSRAHRYAAEVLREHRLDLSPRAQAGTLSLSEQRRLGVVKVLLGDGRLIILDEPTTGLSFDERRDLMTWVRELADRGVTFVYISHHNDEVRQLCTEYTVLRDGKVVSTGSDVAGLSPARLSSLVTGADVDEFHRDRREPAETAVTLEGFATEGVEPFDLSIGRGEVVGFIGLPGSGAQETMRALAGLKPSSGVVRIGGRRIRVDRPGRALESGVTYLTHDRMGEGLVPSMPIDDNLHLGAWPSWARIFVSRREMTSRTEQDRTGLGIRMGSPRDEVSQLSGGNAQKVLMGRMLLRKPSLLLLDEPTLGVDVGAKEDIHRLIDAATRQGTSIVVRAYDPDETARVVDRAITFAAGRVTGALAGDDLTIEAVSTAQHLGGTRV